MCWNPPSQYADFSLSFCSKILSNSSSLPHKTNLFFESCREKLKLKSYEGRGFCIGVRRLRNLMEPLFDNIICVGLIWWSIRRPLLNGKNGPHRLGEAGSWPTADNLLSLFIPPIGTQLQGRSWVNFHSFFYHLANEVVIFKIARSRDACQ